MPRAGRPQGLARCHRFTERGAFGPVLRGSRKLRGSFLVLHAAPAARPARLGVALTRRLVRSAVARNRIKRMVREAFRRHAVKNGSFDCVLALRERYDATHDAALRAEVERLFDKLVEAAGQ